MSRYNKIFLVENGKTVYLQDEEGQKVCFDDFKDFNRCSGIDLTGKFYIGYEPSLHYFADDSDSEVSPNNIPYQQYEDAIAQIAVLQERKDNPLYGLSGQDLFDAQNAVDEKTTRETFVTESEAPVTATIPEGTFTFDGGQDSASYIQGAIQLAQDLGEANVSVTDIGNEARTLSFESASTVAIQIGKAFRTAFFKKQATLVAITNRVFTP